MVAATVEKVIETGNPYIEVVRVEFSDAETYQTRKFRFIEGALLGVNHDSDTTTNVEDDDSSAINGAQDGVILNAPGVSDHTGTLVLFGRR